MQNNENHPNRRRIRNFFREKGYYIVLGLCVCAVGVSGWLFVSNAVSEKRSSFLPGTQCVDLPGILFLARLFLLVKRRQHFDESRGK